MVSVTKAFYQFKRAGKGALSDDSELLHEQIASLQTQNQSLAKQLGKALRSFNAEKPVKLNLSQLLSKEAPTLDFIL
jgi:hypothetical protein